jgi:hypothetical protein
VVISRRPSSRSPTPRGKSAFTRSGSGLSNSDEGVRTEVDVLELGIALRLSQRSRVVRGSLRRLPPAFLGASPSRRRPQPPAGGPEPEGGVARVEAGSAGEPPGCRRQDDPAEIRPISWLHSHCSPDLRSSHSGEGPSRRRPCGFRSRPEHRLGNPRSFRTDSTRGLSRLLVGIVDLGDLPCRSRQQ